MEALHNCGSSFIRPYFNLDYFDLSTLGEIKTRVKQNFSTNGQNKDWANILRPVHILCILSTVHLLVKTFGVLRLHVIITITYIRIFVIVNL